MVAAARTWEQEFLRPGVYHGHRITKDDLEEYAKNTNDFLSRGYSVPVFTKHKPPGAPDGGPVVLNSLSSEQIDALGTVGWLRGVRVTPDGRAVHQLELTNPDAQKAVDEGSIRFSSPELALNYRDAEGRHIGKLIRHVALTPTPRNPKQGNFVAMSEPNEHDELVCVQFSLEDYKSDEEDDDTEDGAVTSDETQVMSPSVKKDASAVGKQVLSDLEAAGIAAPRGVDPIKDPVGFLQQLCASLRQKAMTEAEAEAKQEDDPMAVTEESGVAQYSDIQQFAEHPDPGVRALAKRALEAEQAAQAEKVATHRGNLSRAIEKAALPRWCKSRLSSLVDAVQFSEDGADEPSLRLSEVLDICTQLVPDHLQFSEGDTAVAEHPDGKHFFDGTPPDPNGVTDEMADAIADQMVGTTYSSDSRQVAKFAPAAEEPQNKGRGRRK